MDNVQEASNLLAYQIYQNCVNFCNGTSKVKDYYTNKPMICYINRDNFINFMQKHINEEAKKGNIQLEINESSC